MKTRFPHHAGVQCQAYAPSPTCKGVPHRAAQPERDARALTCQKEIDGF